jgi:hypothetical protein
MIFQTLRSIRSSNERHFKVKPFVASEDVVEWDGEGGFNVSIQERSWNKPINDSTYSGGRFGRISRLCRSHDKNRYLKYIDDSSNMCPKNACRKSALTMFPSDESCDVVDRKITMSTHSSSQDIRREIARCVLTSLLSQDETGWKQSDGKDCGAKNQEQHGIGSDTRKNRYILSTLKAGDVKRSHSYDDTVFDGIIDKAHVTEEPASKEQVPKIVSSSVSRVSANVATVKRFWPTIDTDICLPPMMNHQYQFTPINHVVSWQDTVVLSALSY